MSAVTVSIINLKGGVGKSTLTMMLGEYLAFAHAKNVLLMDMDAQANLSYCMIPDDQIVNQTRDRRTAYHLLRAGFSGGPLDVRDYITQPPLVVSNIARSGVLNRDALLHMVISTPNVAQLDEDLISLWEKGATAPQEIRSTLLRAIEPARRDYDYILIDCPPGLSVFSSTAMMASDYFVSPIIPEPLSLEGVELVQARQSQLRERFGANVEFKGVVLNIVKHYRNTHKRVAEHVYNSRRARFEPFENWLPDSELLRKLGEYDPDIQGYWAQGQEQKFPTLFSKYRAPNSLTNPDGGSLDRQGREGKTYRLEQRISRLAEEFLERCP